MVPVKRKDLFKLLGLNDPLDMVDPTEVWRPVVWMVESTIGGSSKDEARHALTLVPSTPPQVVDAKKVALQNFLLPANKKVQTCLKLT